MRESQANPEQPRLLFETVVASVLGPTVTLGHAIAKFVVLFLWFKVSKPAYADL